MARAGRGTRTALALVAVLAAAACAGGSETGVAGAAAGRESGASGSRPAVDSARRRPVVEVPSGDGSRPFLDPAAEPTTALGRLRAQHLPVWTSDFDWAFPPEVCNSAWELDGIAEPTANGDLAMLGDFATAAALTVMRYEHQLSRALADPTPLSQLCVATASVDPARSEILGLLASHIRSGTRSRGPSLYPDEVVHVGGNETAILAVACTTVADAEATGEHAPSPARLKAYLLSVSRGLEDVVPDTSYRVSDATHRSAEDCTGLDAWAAEWRDHVQSWIAEGRIWEPLGVALTAEGICTSPPPEGPDECPRDWPQ